MRKYIPFFKAGMLEELSYKTALFSWMLITVLQLACVVFLWSAVYANSESAVINGYTFEQIIVYFVMSNILGFTILRNDTLSIIDDEIKDGTIAISFIRPISYRIRFISRTLGCVALKLLILGIPAYIAAFAIFIAIGYIQITSIPLFLCYVGLFILCQITAIAINDIIGYICGILCFYTTAAWGINQAKDVVINFFSGVLIPLAFFPGVFGRVCEQLPFAGLTQNLVLIITQSVSLEQAAIFIAKNIVWFIAFEIFAKLLFSHASKKVTVQGG